MRVGLSVSTTKETLFINTTAVISFLVTYSSYDLLFLGILMYQTHLNTLIKKECVKVGLILGVQDPRDGFGDYHSSSPERSQQRSQQP